MLQSLFRFDSRSLLLSVALLGLSACGPIAERAYRIDVRQGNYVNQAMLTQLSPGMTEEQVRFIMGSPILIDPFHAGRWDYIYRFTPGRGRTEDRRVTLIFDQGKLLRVDGDVAAANTVPGTPEPGTPRVIEIEGSGAKK